MNTETMASDEKLDRKEVVQTQNEQPKAGGNLKQHFTNDFGSNDDRGQLCLHSKRDSSNALKSSDTSDAVHSSAE